jgi:hypothetical protein
MKNSKDNSDKIKKLYKSLKKKYGRIEPVTHETITESLVYGAISEHLIEEAAKETFANMVKYFSDFNELRVSRTEEIVEAINYSDDKLAREVAQSIIRILAGIFTSYNSVDLENLKKLGKRPARQALEKLESISEFIIDYCMLTALSGHAIPLNAAMIDYLVDKELIHPSSDQKDIEGFLTRLISAKQGYEFYSMLRQESDAYKPKKKKITKADDGDDATEAEVKQKAAPVKTTKKKTKVKVDKKVTKKKKVTKEPSKTSAEKTKKKAVKKKKASKKTTS